MIKSLCVILLIIKIYGYKVKYGNRKYNPFPFPYVPDDPMDIMLNGFEDIKEQQEKLKQIEEAKMKNTTSDKDKPQKYLNRPQKYLNKSQK